MIARSLILRNPAFRTKLLSHLRLVPYSSSKAALYKEQGYLVIPNVINQEDDKAMRNAANTIIKNAIEQPSSKHFGGRREIQDEYLFYSGGKKVSSFGQIY